MKTTIFISFLVFLSIVGCRRDYYDLRLKFTNNSENAIYVSTSDKYVDSTVIFINYNPFNSPQDNKILPHETKTPIKPIGKWESIFEENDTISFFIFDADIIENTPWDTIKKNYLF